MSSLCSLLERRPAMDRTARLSYENARTMKQDNQFEIEIPVGVSLTHDKGHPIFFAYVGGGRGRLGMKAKRFNPRTLGGMEKALKQAIRWRKQALKEHAAALAALPPAMPKRKVAKGRAQGKPAKALPNSRGKRSA